MGQYIEIATPDMDCYKRNLAISHIITFLGIKYKETHSNILIQSLPDSTAGLYFIDKECGKGYKSTIRNLIASKNRSTLLGERYLNWKIHKSKTEFFFLKLNQVLRRTAAPQEIWVLFDVLYIYVSKHFGIHQCGSNIIAYPYRTELNHVINNHRYTKEEQHAAARIEKTFGYYNKYYHC